MGSVRLLRARREAVVATVDRPLEDYIMSTHSRSRWPSAASTQPSGTWQRKTKHTPVHRGTNAQTYLCRVRASYKYKCTVSSAFKYWYTDKKIPIFTSTSSFWMCDKLKMFLYTFELFIVCAYCHKSFYYVWFMYVYINYFTLVLYWFSLLNICVTVMMCKEWCWSFINF